ncbi:hypothetical protein ANCCAN_14077 [Ancylostoma caninum]|uniref:Uncharacterized protein n=1 Tax=Ancylostoma caninum TaxID=29170 RepID=A0A368G9N5_ANCCA|nr:hypothetical protein ANCCAN_14077 [Ancylostoma caninum]
MEAGVQWLTLETVRKSGHKPGTVSILQRKSVTALPPWDLTQRFRVVLLGSQLKPSMIIQLLTKMRSRFWRVTSSLIAKRWTTAG